MKKIEELKVAAMYAVVFVSTSGYVFGMAKVILAF